MHGKKIIGGFFCTIFCVMMTLCGSWTAFGRGMLHVVAAEDAAPDPAQLYAASAVLMDADTGRVLYGKNPDVPMAMASTTKIMTCILVLENGSLEDEISVSAYAASMPKVKIYVKKGERFFVKDLLYSLMLESHNDSAVVLAEYIGKQMLGGELAQKDTAEYSVEESKQAVAAFAALMNQKAVELRCVDTCFVTPNGLDAKAPFVTQEETAQDGAGQEERPEDTAQEVVEQDGTEQSALSGEHHTTARELAKIMSYCITVSAQREAFLNITATPSYSFHANGKDYACTNHNAFLNMMEGMISGKTGFTNKAGYCYVGALEREERTFVVALLACGWPNHKSYKWSDTRKLMEYGTQNYFLESLTMENTQIQELQFEPVQVINGRTEELGAQVWAQIARNETGRGVEKMLLKEGEKVEVGLRQLKKVEAPVEKETVVGYVTYSVQGVVYRVEDIVVTQSVDKITFKWCLEEVLERFLP